MIGLGLGLGRRRLMGPVALRQFVAAAPKGAWFWPAQAGNLWQTDTQTTPATEVGQAVGRLDGRGPTGAAVAYSQSSAGLRPALAAAGLIQFDGNSDILEGTGAILNIAQAANAVTFIGRVKFGALAAAQQIIVLSPVGAGNRFSFRVLSNGGLQFSLRRLDADSPMAYNTAAGVVAANTAYSIIASVDYVGNTASIYLNGGSDILAATLTLASSPGPTSNTASVRARIGASAAAVPIDYFPGSIGMFALTNTIPTAAERAAIFADLAL